MGVHDEIARLVDEAGPGVLEDGDSFRAALDDYLAEDAATRGELNLLVDAVRLGTFARLLRQVEQGAETTQAVRLLGRDLARDRGTTESGSAAWALGVLAFAVGRLAEDELAVLRAEMAASVLPERPAVAPEAAGPEAPEPAVVAATTVKRPSTIPLDDEGEARPRRVGRILLAVGAAVVLLVAGVAFASGWGDGGQEPDDSASGPRTNATEAVFAPLEVDGGTAVNKGVRSARTYRLSATGVSSTVVLTNTTKKPLTALWTEVVPKELADHVSQVDFKPVDRVVLEADPVVYWRIRLAPGGNRKVRWSTALPAGAVPSADYLARVTGWHEEAFTTALPLIRRAVPKQAREGEVVPIPDVPDVPASAEPVAIPTSAEPPETEQPPVVVPTTAQPPATKAANRAPRLSLSAKSTGERTSGAYTVGGSDPDGDSWSVVSVSGAPLGVGRTGSKSLGGTVSHKAAAVTTSRSNIRSTSFRVTVTIQDSRGARASGSFTWSVRDTHLTMPAYVGKYGDNPSIGTLFVPNFTGCLDTGREVDTIFSQSVPAGSPVAWGARPRFVYVHHSGDYPAC